MNTHNFNIYRIVAKLLFNAILVIFCAVFYTIKFMCYPFRLITRLCEKSANWFVNEWRREL